MTMGTRIVLMKDGIMQQNDTPQNLYDFPENLFVAGFIAVSYTHLRGLHDEVVKKSPALRMRGAGVACLRPYRHRR